jgi:putative flippase GtrA
MKSQRKVNSRQRARAANARANRRATMISANRRRAAAAMGGAPVAISEDMQQFTRFGGGSSPDSITMHTCVALTELLRVANHSSGTAIGTPGGPGISLQLNLTQPARLSNAGTKFNTSYITPVFDLIASAFVKYKVHKLVFHYEPQSAATTTERMVFAFAEDPMHPVLWNATLPTQDTLLGLADSIAFAPWRSWSMDVSHKLSRNEFYTFTDPSTTVASFAERFSDFGVMSCITSATDTTQISAGVLYVETIVELMEFCPISVTLPASKFLSSKFSEGSASTSYSQPLVAVEDLKLSEVRRLCELEVRKLEYVDPPQYAAFRSTWPCRIETEPRELLCALQAATRK